MVMLRIQRSTKSSVTAAVTAAVTIAVIVTSATTIAVLLTLLIVLTGCSGAGAGAGTTGPSTVPRRITTEMVPVSHPESVPVRRPVPWQEMELRRFAEAIHSEGWDANESGVEEGQGGVAGAMGAAGGPTQPVTQGKPLRAAGEAVGPGRATTLARRRRPSEHPALPEPVDPLGQPRPTRWTYDADSKPARSPDHQLPWKMCIYWEDEADDNRVSCSEESGAAERVTFTVLIPGRIHEHPFLLKRMGRRYMGVIYENGRPYYEWRGTLIASPAAQGPVGR